MAAILALPVLPVFVRSGAAQTPPSAGASPTPSGNAPSNRLRLRLGKASNGGGAKPPPNATARPTPSSPAQPGAGGTAQPAPSPNPQPPATGTAQPAPTTRPTPGDTAQPAPSSSAQPAPDATSQPGPSATPRAPSLPAKIDICITSVAVAPTKTDGSPWDVGGQKLSEDEQRAFNTGIAGFLKTLAKLASMANAQTAIATELFKIFQKPVLQAISKPDVFGTVEYAPTGSYSSKDTKKLPIASAKKPVRELYPNFGTTVCFLGATTTKSMRLRIDLTDKDLIGDDDKIATVEIVEKEVSEAYGFGKSLPIYVGSQDTGQLKFVNLSVTSGGAD